MGTESDPAGAAWPAHGRERRPWRTSPDARDRSGRRAPLADRQLSEITVGVPCPIAGRSLLLSSKSMISVERASAAIAELDARSGAPLSGVSTFLLRSESVASSKIERIYGSRDELVAAMAGHESTNDARLVVAAIEALDGMVRLASSRPISRTAVLSAHRRLLEDDRDEGSHAGRYRTMQNWIGGSDFTPRGAAYVPPPPDLVPPLMTDLLEAADQDHLPAIASAAIVHAQFESIHPFTDGNGRIGRALLSAVLRRRRLCRNVIVPVAAAMLADADTYFRWLDRYRDGDADGFVGYVADAAALAAAECLVTTERLARLPMTWAERARPRAKSGAAVLLTHLVAEPVLDAGTAQVLTGGSHQRAYDALHQLSERGVLTEMATHPKVWMAAEVLDELEDLEDRIGHRVVSPSAVERAQR